MILVSFLPYIDSSPAYVGAVIVLISACVGAVIAVDKVLFLCCFEIDSPFRSDVSLFSTNLSSGLYSSVSVGNTKQWENMLKE